MPQSRLRTRAITCNVDISSVARWLRPVSLPMPREDDGGGVGERILRYLDERPEAADTADGIRQWWLRQEGVERSPADVQAALDRLVEQRRIARIDRPGMSPIYRRGQQLSDRM
jgi:hypothetical protein